MAIILAVFDARLNNSYNSVKLTNATSFETCA